MCNVTLPETNGLPLKMDGWNTTFLLGFGLFQGRTVSFRECNWLVILSDEQMSF